MTDEKIISLDSERQQEITNNLYSPIKISFTGNMADKHLIDGEQFGLAINGASKIFNNVSHFCFTGIVPAPQTKRRIRIYANPPERGSVTYTLWAMMAFGEMSVYPPLWGELADFFIPEFVKAIYMKMTNNNSGMENIVGALLEDRQRERQHTENIVGMAFTNVLQDRNQTLETIEKLADGLRTAAINSVEPIGNSCKQANYLSKNNSSLLVVDEPMAEVMRSKEKLEIEAMKQYNCLVKGINIETGSAFLLVEGSEILLHATINGPVLNEAGNIYTTALNSHAELVISAKATSKNGKINKLFVSDATFKS